MINYDLQYYMTVAGGALVGVYLFWFFIQRRRRMYGLEVRDERGVVTLDTNSFTVRLVASVRTSFGSLAYNESKDVSMSGVTPDMHVIIAPLRDYGSATSLHSSRGSQGLRSSNPHEPWSTPYGVAGKNKVTLKAHGVDPNGAVNSNSTDHYGKVSNTSGDVMIYVFTEV